MLLMLPISGSRFIKPIFAIRSNRSRHKFTIKSNISGSERIAAKHYLQVRDSDFERALEVVRNPVRAMAINDAKRRHDGGGEPTENADTGQETPCAAHTVRDPLGRAGFEPATDRL